MNQFEVWWADLPEPAGRRPVLLLSRSDAYSYLSKFIAVEITSTIRQTATEVSIGERKDFPESVLPTATACEWFPACR